MLYVWLNYRPNFSCVINRVEARRRNINLNVIEEFRRIQFYVKMCLLKWANLQLFKGKDNNSLITNYVIVNKRQTLGDTMLYGVVDVNMNRSSIWILCH